MATESALGSLTPITLSPNDPITLQQGVSYGYGGP
jgi:hypothetical protein